jgi:hypothetical protein
VHRLRSHNATLAGARRTKRYASELRTVAANIELMPLWKLQRIGNEVDEFLYRRAEFADGSIRLLPGVPAAFESLHGLVVDVERWALSHLEQAAALTSRFDAARLPHDIARTREVALTRASTRGNGRARARANP